MPFYRRGGVGSRGAIPRSSGLNTSRKAEFVILRSPENITDVDPDTEDDWDREYRPKINKNNKPAKKVARPADDVESLVDLEDYSPRGPSRKRRGVKVDPSSNISIPSGRASFVESPVGGGYSPRPSEEDSGDDYTPLPSKASKVTGRSCANKEVGKARARADSIVCASSTGRRSAAQKTESTQRRKQERTASYEAKTAERVAEIAAKRAPHLVALARINAEAEKLREQLRLKKQEREIMERVWGVVRSREKAKIGVEKKTAKPKTIARIAESGNEGPPEISSSDEVERKMSLLREELQEESEGWNSLFDESEKMSGVDSIEVGKPAIPRLGKRTSGRSQATSETGYKSQNQGETLKSSFEENTGGELAESTGSEPASDSDSLFGDSKAVPEQGRRSQFGETKKSLAGSKNSHHEKRGSGDSQPTREEEKRQHNGRKRKYRFEENTNDEIARQKGSQKTSGFPVSSDSLFDDFGAHSGQGNRKKLKEATKVLRGRPRKESGIHSRGAFPTKKSLRLHDEEVASKKRVEYDKGGDIMETNNHPPDWHGLGEGVGEGHRGLAASELVASGVGSGEIYSKPSSPLQRVGGGGYSSIREVQVDLGENKGQERPDGERGGRGTGDELELVNEEIDLFLRGCGANSTSLHDRQEGYDVDLFDPLPEMPWGKLVGAGGGGDSSTTAERAITNPMHMGPSAQERELQSVPKQLEKDLDVMDWDKAEAEFLKFDGAALHPAIEDPKDDVGLSGVGGQVSGIENEAGALKPQPNPSRPRLPRDAPGGGTRGKVLACLEQGREGHRLGRPEDWINTSEGGGKVKICNLARVHNPARKGGGRVRSRPYSLKEISEYSLASLFETYKREIEEMEMKATKSVGPNVMGDDRGRTGEIKSQAQGAGGALEEKSKAGVLPDIHRGGVYESKAGNRRVYTLSEWSDCARNGKRQQGEAVWDVTARPHESGKIAEKERAEGKIAGATTGSLELARQKREGSGFVGTDASCPEDGEIIEPEQRESDHISRDVHRAKLPDDSMRPIEASCDRGGFMAKALDPCSAVFPGETAKLYRVELIDGSMGYVLAEVLSGEWSMVFMTDAPGDGHEKTRGSPPQKEFDGGLLSEAGEMAWESPQGALESISQERARSESHETWSLGPRHGIDGRNARTVWSGSPALKRTFQESKCGGVEEEEQRDQESKRQKLDTQGHHPDNNDWD